MADRNLVFTDNGRSVTITDDLGLDTTIRYFAIQKVIVDGVMSLFYRTTSPMSTDNAISFRIEDVLTPSGSLTVEDLWDNDLNLMFNPANQNIAGLQIQVDDNEADLITAQADIVTLQGEMVTAQGDITTLQGEMVTAQSDITTLQSDVTTAQGDITTLQGEMTTAQADIVALEFVPHTYTIDVTPSGTEINLNQAAAAPDWANAGTFNVTMAGNATFDTAVNFPTIRNFEIHPEGTGILTLNRTVFASLAADGEFVGSTATFAMDADKGEWGEFRAVSLGGFTVIQAIEIHTIG